MIEQVIPTSFFTRTLARCAGYPSAQRFLCDVVRHDLPIRDSGSRLWRDNLYRRSDLVKALVLGKLRTLGFPASKAGPWLNQIDHDEVEQAMAKLQARGGGNLWLVISPLGGSLLVDHAAALANAVSDFEESLTIDLAGALIGNHEPHEEEAA
ncbi:hypothetical protein G6N82_06220 [Altererythrobacter sp. BO-6]|uniref:hypothetical protein n=1 Tax=Altererythrobacter sp. BO-6 TaxID=2604537 RepID=UPI0013E1B9CD|nr:hypothetical protein [Altererythrobacter sp. BO-6]QIG53805.1 hypothetical protein G6N82_06220 [Altererythrobacter sp. BO-6]